MTGRCLRSKTIKIENHLEGRPKDKDTSIEAIGRKHIWRCCKVRVSRKQLIHAVW